MKIMVSCSAERVRKQTGVLPYRKNKDGEIEVLLIRSSHAGNWGFPKGKKEKHLGKKESALVEAWEEAGVKGKAKDRIGEYSYRKGSTGVMQHVVFYSMVVKKEFDDYPEKHRERRWFPIDKAIKKLDKNNRGILAKFEAFI